jgi:hypothetical protein
MPSAIHIVGDDFRTRQPICQPLNGVFGNTHGASVHIDGTKSRWPKLVTCALRRRNSLRMAIQVWPEAWPRYCLRARTAHPTQKQETVETASLTSPSQLPPNLISWRDQILAAFYKERLVFKELSTRAKARPQDSSVPRRGFRNHLHERERQRIDSFQLEA